MAGLDRDTLARLANVAVSTIARLEAEPARLRANLATLDGLAKALAARGVVFTERGVELRGT